MIKKLSKGYLQRVGMADARLGNNEIIILDEPTIGLDPYQIIGVRKIIDTSKSTRTLLPQPPWMNFRTTSKSKICSVPRYVETNRL
jgi:ABC-type polar amino acid transport system ATPase subunit